MFSFPMTMTQGAVAEESLDLTGLLAWYKLDETSGDALDAHSTGRTLTQDGTVGSTTGVLGNARNWATSNDANFFSRSDTSFAAESGVIYGSAWVRMSAVLSYRSLIGYYGSVASSRRWLVYYRNSDTTIGIYSYLPSTISFVRLPFAINTNYFLEWYVTPTEIGIALDRDTFSILAVASGPRTDGSATPFRIGRSGVGEPWIGWAQNVTIWNTLPTESRRDYLWNGGAGNTYPG